MACVTGGLVNGEAAVFRNEADHGLVNGVGVPEQVKVPGRMDGVWRRSMGDSRAGREIRFRVENADAQRLQAVTTGKRTNPFRREQRGSNPFAPATGGVELR